VGLALCRYALSVSVICEDSANYLTREKLVSYSDSPVGVCSPLCNGVSCLLVTDFVPFQQARVRALRLVCSLSSSQTLDL
jgi:hypothetical protein